MGCETRRLRRVRSTCGWSSRAKNLVSGAEDSLCGAFVHALALIPVLDVTPAELPSRQAKRFAAKQRDSLGLYFAEFSRRVLEVGKVLLGAMAEDNVGEFVEKRFVRERRKRADGDLAASPGVTLRVAVQVLKLDALDTQRLKRLLLVLIRNQGGLLFRAFRLREHKPMGLVREMRVGEFLILLGAVLFGHGLCALAGHRHAQRQRLLAPFSRIGLALSTSAKWQAAPAGCRAQSTGIKPKAGCPANSGESGCKPRE
jgi:hypothetical protein